MAMKFTNFCRKPRRRSVVLSLQVPLTLLFGALVVGLGERDAFAVDVIEDVVATIGFGAGVGELGFTHGESGDVFASLTSVDETGNASIVDLKNHRVVVLDPNGVERFSVGAISDGRYLANDILALGVGRVVVAFRTSEPLGLLRVYDVNGTVVTEKASESAGIKMRLANGNFLMYLASGYGEYTAALEQTRRHADLESVLPSRQTIGEYEVIRWSGQCWRAPASLSAHPESVALVGTALRYWAPHALVNIGSDGTVQAWDYPDETYTAPTPPAGILNPGLWVEARTQALWRMVSLVVGLDGNFYGLAYTPDHYELIRWNLDELPKQTFPPVQNQPPVITFDGPTTVKVGQRLLVWVRSTDAEKTHITLTPVTLPEGAALKQAPHGNKAALSWTPTEQQLGRHTASVSAEDSMCGKATKEVTITVER